MGPIDGHVQVGVKMAVSTLVSTLYLERSRDSVALRSPCVSAPRLSSLLATMLANLCSPASSDMRNTYSGAFTWLERWVRPGGRAIEKREERGKKKVETDRQKKTKKHYYTVCIYNYISTIC